MDSDTHTEKRVEDNQSGKYIMYVLFVVVSQFSFFQMPTDICLITPLIRYATRVEKVVNKKR